METATAPGTMALLTRLAKSVYRRSNATLLGMRLKEYGALWHLREHGGEVPQQALCDALYLDANNVVLLLNELEAAGLVERRRDPHDRRRHIVELTRAGRRALVQAEKAMESVQDEVLAALGPAQRAALHELLEQAVAGVPSVPLVP